MIDAIISSVINISAAIVVLHNISSRKIDFKSWNIYVAFIFMVVFGFANFACSNSFIRLVISTLIIFTGNYIMFKDEIRKNLVSSILNQLIVVISELTYMVFLFFLLQPVMGSDFINSVYGNLMLNVVVSILMVILSVLPITKVIYSKILNVTNKLKISTLIVFMILLIISINILIFLIYAGSSVLNILIINILFLVIYAIIIYFAINEKNENTKFKKENEMLINSLNDYEKMLDYQRVNNHENKNQLLVIRSMISKNNKKALDYLDEIIIEKRKDDEGLYTYAKIIPEGGLQGLVYQKMLKMKENNIKINLNVDRQIRKVNFNKISSKTNYDLCRIVGIILDNAIEEVIKLNDREVLISMYKDENEFIIEVSNKCDEIPDLSKLDEKGYTTKSKGHGYGLSLLKEIISNNERFENFRSLNKDIFTQIIKIKM